MTVDDFRTLFRSYLDKNHLPWALKAYQPQYMDRPDYWELFRKFLDYQLRPESGSFHPIEYKELKIAVFGSLDELPLLINSEVPGIPEVAKYRLFIRR